MPRLIIYVPFTRAAKDDAASDVRANATEMASKITVPQQIVGDNITEVKAVFAGEESADSVGAGDILIVHAHGGQADSDLTDNVGQDIKAAKAVENLTAMNAGRAAVVFFVVCYSAKEKHIAHTWKERNKDTKVYGSTDVVQGAIVQLTRSGNVRNAIMTDEGRMTEV